MNIDEMSDQEKSVHLARLNPEWYVIERPDYARVCRADRIGACLFQITKLHNFFTTDDEGNPHLMPFAQKVLIWAHDHRDDLKMSVKGESTLAWFFAYTSGAGTAMDGVLSLAIDAGMVGQTAVTDD